MPPGKSKRRRFSKSGSACCSRRWATSTRTREVQQTQLGEESWRQAARDLTDALISNSKSGGTKVNLSDNIDELIVVPDGPLWYLPFECLQVAPAGADPKKRSRDGKDRVSADLEEPRPLSADDGAGDAGALEPQADAGSRRRARQALSARRFDDRRKRVQSTAKFPAACLADQGGAAGRVAGLWLAIRFARRVRRHRRGEEGSV